MVIDGILRSHPVSWEQFIRELRQEMIEPMPYANKEGYFYGLSFIDLEGKLVVKASELGKGYGIAAILRQLGLDPFLRPLPPESKRIETTNPLGSAQQLPIWQEDRQNQDYSLSDLDQAIKILFRAENESPKLPYELKARTRKKKKNSIHH
jgi:hypothetical protein